VVFVVDFVVELHGLLSKNGKFLLKILYPIIGAEHLLLFLRLILNLGKFLPNLLNMRPISKKKLRLMFLNNMFHLTIHIIYGRMYL
jgi:hypothetical protein